jgi:hypothetical protein
MHPNAKATLKATMEKVPDSNFLSATFFCQFESTTVAASFKLYNENGQDVSGR